MVGLWVLVISVLALRGNTWPKGLAYLGIDGAFIYFLALGTSVIPYLVVSGAGTATAGIGTVFAPIWYSWMGIHLRRIGLS